VACAWLETLALAKCLPSGRAFRLVAFGVHFAWLSTRSGYGIKSGDGTGQRANPQSAMGKPLALASMTPRVTR
jgi:hypothetical protein